LRGKEGEKKGTQVRGGMVHSSLRAQRGGKRGNVVNADLIRGREEGVLRIKEGKRMPFCLT